MDELPTNDQLTEAEIKAAQQRREAFKRELQARGELPKDASIEELEKSKRSWQRSI